MDGIHGLLDSSLTGIMAAMIQREYYTVSRLTQSIKAVLDTAFEDLWVRGEVSGLKVHSSGHIYFALKDRDARISAVVFRGSVPHLACRPTEGAEVLCRGRMDVYPPHGSYSLVVERMEAVGQGALLEELEKRRRRLEAEGLFDPARKRPLPLLPGTVGLVTSPTSAAIQDMLRVIFERYPARVLVYPARVQGEGAAAELVRGLQVLGAQPDVDVIILGRGGGATEDLLAFSEEAVVRAVATCPKPVISAVGHETDTPLCDFAADLRAPTPTAAAEAVVPRLSDLQGWAADRRRSLQRHMRSSEDYARRLTDDLRQQLELRFRGALEVRQTTLGGLRGELWRQHPRNQLDRRAEALARLKDGLALAARDGLASREQKLERAKGLFAVLGPRGQLLRGYALVKKVPGDGRPLTDAAQVASGDGLEIVLAKGAVKAVAE
jgi:exodeoxyribonuclease VII large subunit